MRIYNFINVFLLLFIPILHYAQSNIVTYAGGSGRETFYDVMQISDGTFLVCGYAENLDWVNPSVPKTQLSYQGNIPNAQGTNKIGFILHLNSSLQNILNVVHFQQGAVEDIRFMKTNSLPYKTTGDLYISCNTADTDNNNGGYIIGKLNRNFVNGVPDALDWQTIVWAKSGPKDYHPWDVASDGKIYYITGESHAYDWSAIYCMNKNGVRIPVENWRTHWLNSGTEWRGTPASSYPNGGISAVNYSGIVLKSWGRCELRSWSQTDYNATFPDGNGGTKKGKWPLDVLFSGPCDPANPTNVSPGYTGYSQSGTPVYGGSSISIDKRNNDLYIGMNFKSVLPSSLPDFEPAVIAMDSTGSMKWWSRLYHEITPAGDTMNSTPDQYIDALAIDYFNNKLVVGARCHGNNVENFWEGNTIFSNPSAQGFQNNFTGTNGDIHISWFGKLGLADGVISNSTYMAEYFEGTGNLGAPHPDPIMDGWPNPNGGWPNVNTTRMSRNALKVGSSGDVCVMAVGRRTMTTSNAYQKMPKPGSGSASAWNSFVRVYHSNLSLLKYSSLVVGVWDTLTQAGGDNVDLFGLYKATDGVICVGRQKADNNNNPVGNNLPVINITPWGTAAPQGESAVLVYYKASELMNTGDAFSGSTSYFEENNQLNGSGILIFPNPSHHYITIQAQDFQLNKTFDYSITDLSGRVLVSGPLSTNTIDVSNLNSGIYVLNVRSLHHAFSRKFSVMK